MRDARIGAPEKYGDGAVLLLIFAVRLCRLMGFRRHFCYNMRLKIKALRTPTGLGMVGARRNRLINDY